VAVKGDAEDLSVSEEHDTTVVGKNVRTMNTHEREQLRARSPVTGHPFVDCDGVKVERDARDGGHARAASAGHVEVPKTPRDAIVCGGDDHHIPYSDCYQSEHRLARVRTEGFRVWPPSRFVILTDVNGLGRGDEISYTGPADPGSEGW
jgi:hypothetical protein